MHINSSSLVDSTKEDKGYTVLKFNKKSGMQSAVRQPRRPTRHIRLSSGVPGFDPLVNGGFKQGSVNLLCGGPGAGKTTMATQFILDGLKKGEAGIYITFEEKKEQFYDDMLGFGWDFKKYEDQGLFRFLEYTPDQVNRVLQEGGGTIDGIITSMNVKRLVIDSITSFSLLFQDDLAQKASSLALFKLINFWGCTAVVTAQAPPSSEQYVTAHAQFEADSNIILYYFRNKGIRHRAIEILKMRGTKIPEQTYKVGLTDRGVVVHSAKLINF